MPGARRARPGAGRGPDVEPAGAATAAGHDERRGVLHRGERREVARHDRQARVGAGDGPLLAAARAVSKGRWTMTGSMGIAIVALLVIRRRAGKGFGIHLSFVRIKVESRVLVSAGDMSVLNAPFTSIDRSVT